MNKPVVRTRTIPLFKFKQVYCPSVDIAPSVSQSYIAPIEPVEIKRFYFAGSYCASLVPSGDRLNYAARGRFFARGYLKLFDKFEQKYS